MYHPPQVAQRLAAAMPQYDFLRQHGSAYVCEIIPREGLLPPDFVPWAPGVVVASRTLLGGWLWGRCTGSNRLAPSGSQ